MVEFLRDKYPQLKIGLASTRSEDIIHKQLDDSTVPYSLHEICDLIDKDVVRGVAARNPARFDDSMVNAEKLDLSIYSDPSPEGQKNFHEKLLTVLFDPKRLHEMEEDSEGKDKKEIYSRLEIILQRISIGKKMLDNGEAGVTILVDNDDITNLFGLLFPCELVIGDRKKGYVLMDINCWDWRIIANDSILFPADQGVCFQSKQFLNLWHDPHIKLLEIKYRQIQNSTMYCAYRPPFLLLTFFMRSL